MVKALAVAVPVKSHRLEVSRVLVPGQIAVNKYGRNPDIDQIGSATAVVIGRDIWDLGIAGATMWVPPTTARTHQIASSNDEDGGAGTDTGALTIRIFGLDAAYLLQQEDLVLNGVTNVGTASTYTMIHRMQVLTAGSVGHNLGNIDATADTDTTVTARITINNNQTKMAIYQIPLLKTGYVFSTYASIHKVGGVATFADTALMIQDFGGVWREQDTMEVSVEGSSTVERDYYTPLVVDAKSYIKMVADPSKDAQDVSAGFDLILVDA